MKRRECYFPVVVKEETVADETEIDRGKTFLFVTDPLHIFSILKCRMEGQLMVYSA